MHGSRQRTAGGYFVIPLRDGLPNLFHDSLKLLGGTCDPRLNEVQLRGEGLP